MEKNVIEDAQLGAKSWLQKADSCVEQRTGKKNHLFALTIFRTDLWTH